MIAQRIPHTQYRARFAIVKICEKTQLSPKVIQSFVRKELHMMVFLRTGFFCTLLLAKVSAFAQIPPSSTASTPAKPVEKPTQRDIEECLNAYKNTSKCCQRPLSCIGMGSGADDVSLAVQFFAMMSTGVISGQDSAQMSKACKMLQAVGTIGTVLNGGAATLCFTMKSRCESTCEKVKKYYESRNDSANVHLASSRIESCRTFMREVTALSQQAIASFGAADMGKMCGEMVQEEDTMVAGIPQFDCSNPANQMDPRCRDCSNPANANNPMCQTPVTPEGTGVSTSDSLAANGDSLFNSNEQNDGNPTKQSPSFMEAGSGQASKASGIPGGGGGFVGSGSTGGGALAGADEGGGGQGGGYNTDVLRGLSGGGGYSGNPGGGATGSPSGGFAGYGQGGPKSASKFDLKQFLPGGEKDPVRKLAGVGLPSPEIGPREMDIWDRVTKRVKEICKLNRLYDCNKL